MTKAELKISEVIRPETVALDINGVTDKDDLIRHLVSLLSRAGRVRSEEEFLAAVYEREELGPTYMGNFIAIPHGKSDTVMQASVAFARSQEGIMYNTAMGGGLVKLVFLLAIPDQMGADQYVRVLARLARLLVHEEFLEALYQASNYGDVVSAIKHGEALLDTD